MTDSKGWGTVGLALLLGLVIGGLAGYIVGSSDGDKDSTSVEDIRANEGDEASSPSGAPTMSNTEICNASDVAQALQVFGTNAQMSLSQAAVGQVHSAGELFADAASLATGDVADAFTRIADVSLGAKVGDAYSFGPYNRVTSACAADGL